MVLNPINGEMDYASTIRELSAVLTEIDGRDTGNPAHDIAARFIANEVQGHLEYHATKTAAEKYRAVLEILEYWQKNLDQHPMFRAGELEAIAEINKTLRHETEVTK
jgi:hypothetical protein